MIAHSKLKVLLICLALLVFVTPVLAGGWAAVTLDEIPAEVRAGETVHLSFVVLQHGKTPVHFLGASDSVPVEPYLMARNLNTGETIRVAAERGKELGHFTLAAVFPSEGEWEWNIAPRPLGGSSEFESLAVQPASVKADKSANTPPIAGATFGSQQVLQVAGAVLFAAALATLVIAIFARRRRMAIHNN